MIQLQLLIYELANEHIQFTNEVRVYLPGLARQNILTNKSINIGLQFTYVSLCIHAGVKKLLVCKKLSNRRSIDVPFRQGCNT